MRQSLFVILICCFSCSGSKTDLKNFDALAGDWKSVVGEDIFLESWKMNNGRLEGEGYFLNKKDTLFGERLVVDNIYGKLVYIADVKGQSPILFTCKNNVENLWQFENMEHDFPQIIRYELKGDSLWVRLTGIQDSTEHTETLMLIKQ